MWQTLRSAGPSLGAVWICLMLGGMAQAAKDQSRIEDLAPRAPEVNDNTGLPGLSPGPDPELPLRSVPEDGGGASGDTPAFPVIETVALTPDLARRALDALHEVKDKYESKGLEDYETLEQFVAEAEAGQQLDADIRRYGFTNVTDWNKAIMTIEFAYSALNGDDAEIKAEIEAVRVDASMSDREREEIMAGLQAMLSTPNNKAIVQDLLNDPVYVNKLKILDAME